MAGDSSTDASLTPIQRFFRLLQPDQREILYVYGYALFNGLINLVLPLGIQAIIGLLAVGQLSTSWWVLMVAIGVAVIIAGLFQVMQMSITEIIQQRIFARSSFEFAYRIPKIRMEAIHNKYLPELINRFFDRLLKKDSKAIFIGEDVKSPYGGAFKIARDLSDKYPNQVFTTPISEAAIVGIGNGLAISGYKPFVEIMFGDFVTLAFDQIVNHIRLKC